MSLIILSLINLLLIYFFSLISFFLFSTFVSKSVQIFLIILSLIILPIISLFSFFFFFGIKGFLMQLFLFIYFSSDCFCVFGLLSFFPLPYMVLFRCICLKKTNNFVSKITYTFSDGLRNIIN